MNEMVVEKLIGAIGHELRKLKHTINLTYMALEIFSEAKYDRIVP
jgi:hypothetical protein